MSPQNPRSGRDRINQVLVDCLAEAVRHHYCDKQRHAEVEIPAKRTVSTRRDSNSLDRCNFAHVSLAAPRVAFAGRARCSILSSLEGILSSERRSPSTIEPRHTVANANLKRRGPPRARMLPINAVTVHVDFKLPVT